MTVYNGMYFCPGMKQPPASVQGWKGQCTVCSRWFMRYPNGMVVMHKRQIRRDNEEA